MTSGRSLTKYTTVAGTEFDRRVLEGSAIERHSCSQLVDQLGRLGIGRGGVLLVHTSYRAIRPVEGGPARLIHALREALGPDGTLVMPSWSGDDDQPFDRKRSAVDADLGVVAQIFWQLPGVLRADHFHAFAAVGPKAECVLQDPLPLPPHIAKSPVGRVHELGGQVLLLGVNHDADTTIHLAETMACVPYGIPRHGTVLRDGRPERVEFRENDHCCRRFNLADDWLRAEGLQREGRVGNAAARLVRAADVARVVVQQLEADPLVFLCPPESGCEECDLARASIEARD